MAAGIVEGPHLPVTPAHDQQRGARELDLAPHEAARLGHLADMADVNPAAQEHRLALPFPPVRIVIGRGGERPPAEPARRLFHAQHVQNVVVLHRSPHRLQPSL